MAEALPAMSLFLQYQLGQAIGDLAHNDGGGDGGGADAAGAGFGFGLGFMMPWLLARAFPPHLRQAPPPPPPALAAPAASPRFCGECGGDLLPHARYCGHCGQAVWRPAR
jgi:hypothetical protein